MAVVGMVGRTEAQWLGLGGQVSRQPWLNLEQAWVLVEEEVVVVVGHLLLVEYC